VILIIQYIFKEANFFIKYISIVKNINHGCEKIRYYYTKFLFKIFSNCYTVKVSVSRKGTKERKQMGIKDIILF